VSCVHHKRCAYHSANRHLERALSPVEGPSLGDAASWRRIRRWISEALGFDNWTLSRQPSLLRESIAHGGMGFRASRSEPGLG
jgi:hypothetical protein